jgi:hypothetical protein
MGTAAVTLILRRLVLAAVIAAAGQVPFVALASSQPAACDAASGPHHVALVVQHGDGSTRVECVAFGGASLTGEQVLANSGIEYETVSFGGLSKAVCQVDGEPSSFPPECWTGQSDFWALFVARAGGLWAAASVGVSSLVLHDGDSEGLRYEPQAQPVAPTIYGHCPAATPTPKPTAKPTPKPTPTSKPTQAAAPSAAASGPSSTAPTPGATEPSEATGSAVPGSPLATAPASPSGLVEVAAGSPDPSAGALVVTPVSGSADPPPGAPIALLLGLAVITLLAVLGIARARTARPGPPP